MLAQLLDQEVPYLSFSGGEPMVHPHFFEMVEYVCARGGQLKIETNGHFLTPANCERLQRLGVKAVQVSFDGATRETFNKMRVRGEFNTALDGTRNLRAAGVPIEINYSPTRFNIHEIGAAVDMAYELGAYSFYTGRTMYTGNAVKTWHLLVPSEAEYEEFFRTLHAKTDEYRGRMRVHFHEMGLLEELRYRLHHPAALLIVLPNGLVKLINALPFICGDLRTAFARGGLGKLPARLAGSARRAIRPRPRHRSDARRRRCTNGSISDRGAPLAGSARRHRRSGGSCTW